MKWDSNNKVHEQSMQQLKQACVPQIWQHNNMHNDHFNMNTSTEQNSEPRDDLYIVTSE